MKNKINKMNLTKMNYKNKINVFNLKIMNFLYKKKN